MRRPAHFTKPRPRQHQFKTFPAPVGGWIANQSLATPGAKLPDGSRVNGAHTIENGFPAATGVRMRRGSAMHAILGDGSQPVEALWAYNNGNNKKLFASTAGAISAIYDVSVPSFGPGTLYVAGPGPDEGAVFTTPAVPGPGEIGFDDGTTIPVSAPILIATDGGAWVSVQFATASGVFLRLVNGTDTPLVYDGVAYGTAPALTAPVAPAPGSDLVVSDLSYVWAYKQRLFFIEKNTLDAYYLNVDEIGGELHKIPLGGVFQRGGKLLFGATWSLDSGSGLTEQCVFVTDEGEVAVYQGSNPASADDWSKVGVYRIGKPRGPMGFIRAGGDLVIATDIGFVPLSQAIRRDYAALSPSAVSYPIEDEWVKAVRSRLGGWHCEVWPNRQMVVIALPTEAGQKKTMLVANARTGAWAPYTGWGGTCLELFDDRMFFGTAEGLVMEAEVGGSDDGLPYTMTVVPLFDPLKTPASIKTGQLARSVFRSPVPVSAKISLQVDYTLKLPPVPNDTAPSTGSLWGTAIWGEGVWGSAADLKTFQDWKSTPGVGYAVAVATQITSGSPIPPSIELVQSDLTYDGGADVGS